MSTQKDLNLLHDILSLIEELSPYLAIELEDNVRDMITEITAFDDE